MSTVAVTDTITEAEKRFSLTRNQSPDFFTECNHQLPELNSDWERDKFGFCQNHYPINPLILKILILTKIICVHLRSSAFSILKILKSWTF
jgi:hypothetical protein